MNKKAVQSKDDRAMRAIYGYLNFFATPKTPDYVVFQSASVAVSVVVRCGN